MKQPKQELIPICKDGIHEQTVLAGHRRNRTGLYQLYKCQKCGRTWTGQRIESPPIMADTERILSPLLGDSQ